MMVDLSHVSVKTMEDTLDCARAPVIFSHSGARGVSDHPRNVPDHILHRVRDNRGIVMVPFVKLFLKVTDPYSATVEDIVDHIYHIANLAGWDHVGIGADYDGTSPLPDGSLNLPRGMTDVSSYPVLIAAVCARGATDGQTKKLMGGNILRVWTEIEMKSLMLQKAEEQPCEDVLDERKFGCSN